MKVPATPKINYDTSFRKNDLPNYSASFGSGMPKDSVSFGSVGPIRKGLTETFKWINKMGFFMEFLIVDTCSMVVPRIVVGLNRDKDKTGKTNYQAGWEEAGREILSGPSMNLIPMGILGAVCAFKPSSRMSRNTLKALTNNMNKVIDETPDLANLKKEDLNKALADKLFEDAFNPEKFSFENREGLKSEFVKLLTNSTIADKKLFNSEAFKSNLNEFKEHVMKINNQGVKTGGDVLLDAKSIKLSTSNGEKVATTSIGAQDLFDDFHNYSKDVIEKLTKVSFAENTAEKAKGFLEKIQRQRLRLKTISAVTAFFAVGSFLLYLPKVYQQGKVSPAAKSAERAKAEAEQGGTNEN